MDGSAEITSASSITNYESPFYDRCTEYIKWDTLTADERLWHIKYYTCPTSYPSSWDNTPIPDEQIARAVKLTLEAFNVTSGIRDFMSTQPDFTLEQIEIFFEFFPEYLEAQSINFSPFFLIPSAYATGPSNHLLSVRGEVELQKTIIDVVAPLGYTVCLYDKRDNGDFDLLKHGIKVGAESCQDISALGDFSIIAVNDDPDDQSGVDLVEDENAI